MTDYPRISVPSVSTPSVVVYRKDDACRSRIGHGLISPPARRVSGSVFKNQKHRGCGALDITGQTFGRLTAVAYAGETKWTCVCSCGVRVDVRSTCLRNGHTKSCGCLSKELTAARFTTHGHGIIRKSSGALSSWVAMNKRCNNPKSIDYHRYGGRGIRVCERWGQFVNFLTDMGDRPSGHTIGRINNNGNYEPGNCRWETPLQQSNNRIDNRIFSLDGESATITQWAKKLGCTTAAIRYRIRNGWDLRAALTQKPLAMSKSSTEARG